ncbi:hypothetical protein ES703_62702 [subsurface metagenome]
MNKKTTTKEKKTRRRRPPPGKRQPDGGLKEKEKNKKRRGGGGRRPVKDNRTAALAKKKKTTAASVGEGISRRLPPPPGIRPPPKRGDGGRRRGPPSKLARFPTKLSLALRFPKGRSGNYRRVRSNSRFRLRRSPVIASPDFFLSYQPEENPPTSVRPYSARRSLFWVAGQEYFSSVSPCRNVPPVPPFWLTSSLLSEGIHGGTMLKRRHGLGHSPNPLPSQYTSQRLVPRHVAQHGQRNAVGRPVGLPPIATLRRRPLRAPNLPVIPQCSYGISSS